MNLSFKYFSFLFLLFVLAACSDDSFPSPNPGGGTDGAERIWTGPTVVFSKTNGSDPDNASNQDRITDNAWITRGNNGGQIYNAKVESSANKDESPLGTEWAVGSINNLANLTFRPFRIAVGSPKDVVGKNLVMRIIEDDVFLSVKFTGWSQGKEGGFSYERSSE